MPRQQIVLVEDELELKELLSEALTDEGFEVIPFTNVEDFLSEKKNFQARLIITDGRLPGRSGYDLITEVRKTDTKTPILLMTGVAQDGDGVKALTEGADDYLEKPVDIKFLIAKVRRLMERAGTAKNKALPNYKLSPETNELHAGDNVVKFTGTEFEVFKYLFENLNELVPRPTLEAHTSKARSLDVHIHAIRRKIKGLPLAVETLKMKGYRLRVKHNPDSAQKSEVSGYNMMSSH